MCKLVEYHNKNHATGKRVINTVTLGISFRKKSIIRQIDKNII